MEADPSPPTKPTRDFLFHLEVYLSKRDGVDKLLKISRYATKIILSADLIPTAHPRLNTFQSTVGLSRKAFRLGKFVQDVNSLRSANLHSFQNVILSILAYGGEGFYYFVEQFVWLAKSGLIHARYSKKLQKISAWAELVGYVGSVSLKVRDLKGILDDEARLLSSIEITATKEDKLREKKMMKKLSLVQDVADGLMAAADVRDGKGRLSGPMLMASAGMVSAIISTHKNWLSC